MQMAAILKTRCLLERRSPLSESSRTGSSASQFSDPTTANVDATASLSTINSANIHQRKVTSRAVCGICNCHTAAHCLHCNRHRYRLSSILARRCRNGASLDLEGKYRFSLVSIPVEAFTAMEHFNQLHDEHHIRQISCYFKAFRNATKSFSSSLVNWPSRPCGMIETRAGCIVSMSTRLIRVSLRSVPMR